MLSIQYTDVHLIKTTENGVNSFSLVYVYSNPSETNYSEIEVLRFSNLCPENYDYSLDITDFRLLHRRHS